MRALPFIRDTTLDRVVDAIVRTFAPSRVILFGSRGRGEAGPGSDYDLLVEMETTLEYWDAVRQMDAAIREARGAHKVDVLIRSPVEFERRRNDVGYIDFDVARDGIVVHPRQQTVYGSSISPPMRVRERLDRGER
jgi:predicted nucleotidyltransferase